MRLRKAAHQTLRNVGIRRPTDRISSAATDTCRVNSNARKDSNPWEPSSFPSNCSARLSGVRGTLLAPTAVPALPDAVRSSLFVVQRLRGSPLRPKIPSSVELRTTIEASRLLTALMLVLTGSVGQLRTLPVPVLPRASAGWWSIGSPDRAGHGNFTHSALGVKKSSQVWRKSTLQG